MSFRRTNSGLSNQHLFYKVDAIVLVEGGRSYSKEEVLQGKFDDNTLDILFWRGLFSVFHSSERLQFRAIGSKSTLKSIANDVATGKIDRVYIAMDRDFDEINNKLLQYRGMIYTYGYSWENDVCQRDIIEDVLNAFCDVDCNEINVKSDILIEFDEFINQINSCVCADALLSIDEKSFFNRKKHLSYLKIKKKTKPTLNIDRIQTTFQECHLEEAKAIIYGKEKDIQSSKYCLGHLLFDYCYHLIAYALEKIGKLPKIAKYYFGCIGIDKFINKIGDGYPEPIAQHYKRSFAALK